MLDNLKDFYKGRIGTHSKDPDKEEFQEDFNNYLIPFETERYKQDLPEIHPFIYIFGLPRSGTTLLTQHLAQGLNIGYINNFIARFYLAPVTGIKLSRLFFKEKKSDFKSDYATTSVLEDIHEFGYFWKYWLKKEKMSDIVRSEVLENEIDWAELKKVLLNIQDTFQSGLVAKNILGAYHIQKMTKIMKNTLFIYIERDPLDVAISILEARKKYYKDLDLWWSYVPLEYESLKDLPFMEQIAGQVYYLRKYYQNKLKENKNILTVNYEELCENPVKILKNIQLYYKNKFNYTIELKPGIPESFPFRNYKNRQKEREEFNRIIRTFEENDITK